MSKTSLPAVNKTLAEEKKKLEKAEEKAALDKPVGDGKVMVRLMRPHVTAEGLYLPVGVHEMPEGAIPASAKVLGK